MNRPTFASVAAAVRALGLTIRRTGYGSEVRIAYRQRPNEVTAYYTDDLSDALGTARVMVQR